MTDSIGHLCQESMIVSTIDLVYNVECGALFRCANQAGAMKVKCRLSSSFFFGYTLARPRIRHV